MISKIIRYIVKKLKQKFLPPLIVIYKTEHGFKLKRQHETDSCFDICASSSQTIPSGGFAAVETGIFLQLPTDCEAQVRSRSGLALKHQVFVLNGIGTIYAGYTGEVKVILFNLGKEEFKISAGDRIAQIHFARLTEVNISISESIKSDSDRKNKGFGSTGV